MRKDIKVLATICFVLITTALVTALVSDGVVFGRNILGFAFALVAAVVAFIFAFFLMIISIIFVFGIYILQDKGFWPLTWASHTFQTIVADYSLTQAQVDTLLTIRIVLLVVCVVVLITSSVLFNQLKTIKKNNPTLDRRPALGFTIVSQVMSIFETAVCLGALLILLLLKTN